MSQDGLYKTRLCLNVANFADILHAGIGFLSLESGVIVLCILGDAFVCV